LIALRNKYPALRRSRFLISELNEDLGVKDVTWIKANGSDMQDGQWKDAAKKCFGMLIDVRALITGIRKRGGQATFWSFCWSTPTCRSKSPRLRLGRQMKRQGDPSWRFF